LSNNDDASVFQPFIVDSIGYPKSSSAILQLPEFFVENLAMLQPIRIKPLKKTSYGNVNKKLSYNCVPVWGVYSRDVPPIFQFTKDGQNYPVFSETSIIPPANLWDCTSKTSATTKVNINNYTDQIISLFNTCMQVFAANKSIPLAPMNVDKNKNSSLLHYTRILEKIPNQLMLAPSIPPNPSDRFVINKPKSTKERDSKKNVKEVAIEPATYYELYTNYITSVKSISADLNGDLRYFLIPSIRLDPAGDDALTRNAYQVYTGEMDSASNISGPVPYTNSEEHRLSNVGSLAVTGLFAATDSPNVLVEAMSRVVLAGQGSDLISSLLGGLASLVPVVGPMLGSLLT
jgi:hypothetical protein